MVRPLPLMSVPLLFSRSCANGSSFMTFAHAFGGSFTSRAAAAARATAQRTSPTSSAAAGEETAAQRPSNLPELRRCRLEALGQMAQTTAGASSEQQDAAQPPSSTESLKGSEPEVVDLLDSDDDDDDSLGGANPTTTRKPAGKNVVDLLDSSSDDEKRASSKRKKPAAAAKKRPPLKPSDFGRRDVPLAFVATTAAVSASRKSEESSDGGDEKKPAAAAAAGKKRKAADQSRTSLSRNRRLDAASSAAGGGGSTPRTFFQVATWNIWFGPRGDGNPHGAARMRELTRLLQRQHSTDQRPLWFVGFQEVVDELAATLVPAMELLGYTVYRQPGAPAYGCALAVHGSLTVTDRGWVPYDRTVMQRGFLYVRARPPGSPPHRQILFATTHLESFTGEEYTGAAQRPRQLRQMELFCNERMALDPSTAVAIITGDMNWDDERPRQGTPTTDPAMATVLSENWQDSWLATKSGWKDTCYTYDGKLNPMLSGNLRRRFDRCLVRSRAGVAAARATSTQLLGTEALPGLTWPKWNRWKQTSREMPTAPSDHFGFVATIQLNET